MTAFTAPTLQTLGLLPQACAIAALIGLFMGSFLNCWAWRIVHGESIVHGRSHCPSCGHVLGPADLVPVFSWLLSRGHCRYCGERVSVRYPITELVCAVAYASIVAVYGLTPEALELIGFASCLLVLTLTDLDDFYIPNGCILAAIGIRLVYIAYLHIVGAADGPALLLLSVLGALEVGVPLLLLVLIMDRVLQRASMGGGDIKLLAVAGFYFGAVDCLFLIVLACLFGIGVAAVQMLRGGGEGSTEPVKDAHPAEDAEPTNDAQPAKDTQLVKDAQPSAPEPSPDPVADFPQLPADEPSPAAEVAYLTIPWGPSIALACWATMLFARPFVDWYLTLF